jgi:hypothetical protein
MVGCLQEDVLRVIVDLPQSAASAPKKKTRAAARAAAAEAQQGAADSASCDQLPPSGQADTGLWKLILEGPEARKPQYFPMGLQLEGRGLQPARSPQR